VVLSQQISANSSSVSSIEIDMLAAGLYTVEVINNQTRATSKVSIVK
jgi:hypothetical protein